MYGGREKEGRREGKRDRRRKRRRDTHVGGRGGGRRGARKEGKGWRERGKEGGRRNAHQHQYQKAYSSLIMEKTLERFYTSYFTLPPHPPMPTHALPHQSRVPDEEDGCVVPHKVPVSILGVKLHCKPTRIPHCVRTSRLTTCCMRGKMRKNGYAKLYAPRVHTNMSEAFKL